jgi:hypothetical protein
MEPGVRSSQMAINLTQEGRYEEAAYSIAGLFASRSSEVMDEDSRDDEESQGSESGKSGRVRD